MLDHPAYSTAFDNAETTVCADTIASMGESIIPFRIKVVNTFRKRGLELESDRAEAAELAGEPFKKIKSPLHIPLMREVTSEYSITDSSLPSKLPKGLPIVGDADACPRFDP